jgi:hypothetical protein
MPTDLPLGQWILPDSASLATEVSSAAGEVQRLTQKIAQHYAAGLPGRPAPCPVGITSRDVLAWNAMAAALIVDFSAYPVERRNFLWLRFCEPTGRMDPADRERTGRNHVADIRALAARRPDDRELAALVARVRAASPEFAELWERHDVEVHRVDRKRIHHPLVGVLDLECEVLFTADLDQRLIVHRAEPGSSSHAALELLKVIGLQEIRDPAQPPSLADRAPTD